MLNVKYCEKRPFVADQKIFGAYMMTDEELPNYSKGEMISIQVQNIDEHQRALELVKIKTQNSAITRKAKLEAWNDYIGFITSKVLGLGFTVIGISELISPDLFNVVVNNPESLLGIGLGLLLGKKAVDVLSKFLESLKEEDRHDK